RTPLQPHPNVAAPRRAGGRPKSPIRRSKPPTPLEAAAKIARKSRNQPLTIQTVAHPSLLRNDTFPRKGGRSAGMLRSVGLGGGSALSLPAKGGSPKTYVMLANASIQNATTLQDLPLGSALDDFPVCAAASSCRHGWIPAFAGMTFV